MTGSPKEAGFSTKEVFLYELSKFGFVHGKMTKKNNEVDILVADDINSGTGKIKMAVDLDVEIKTYQELKNEFSLEGDLF